MVISTDREPWKYGNDKFNLLKSSKGKETIKADNISALMKVRCMNYILV